MHRICLGENDCSEQIKVHYRIPLFLSLPSIMQTQDVVSSFQSRHVALHQPPLAVHTALTHINMFIIDTSSGPVSGLAYQMLKEIVQSNLKWPRGNFHNHVPISSTVNNGNAKGHCVPGWEEGIDRGRRETSSSLCPLFIVNGFYTDKKHLIRHTHTYCWAVDVEGAVLWGQNYTTHEDNK